MHVYAKQYLNVKLKFRMNKNYHEKRKAYWCVSCLNLFKQRLIDVTTFRLSKSLISRSVPFRRINNFGSIFTNRLDRGTYETKLPTYFFIFYLSYHFNFSSGAQNFPFIVNKNPTSCNSMQIFIYCKVTLHVSGVTATIIRSTKNCNRNLQYRS